MQKNWWYLVIIFVFLMSCIPQNERMIEIEKYRFVKENNILRQQTPDINDAAVFGVIGDAHGRIDRIRDFIEQFKEQDVEYIIFVGDISEHFRKTPEMLDDEEQIYQLVKLAAETKLPVFVIPGNHDTKDAYYSAINRIGKDNVIDGTKFRFFDGDDADIIFVPGYFDELRTVENGFLFNKQDVELLYPLIEKADNDVVLAAHTPHKGTTSNGIDVAYGAGNVGSPFLTQLIDAKNIKFSISGHIHEAGGKGITSEEATVNEGDWSEELYLNAGTAIPWTMNDGTTNDGIAAVMWIKEGIAKYVVVR